MVIFENIEIKEQNLLQSILEQNIFKKTFNVKKDLIKLTFFVGCFDNNTLNTFKNNLNNVVSSLFEGFSKPAPCLSIVAQQPLSDNFCVVEAVYFCSVNSNYQIEFSDFSNLRYCLIQSPVDSFLFTSSIPSYSLETLVEAPIIYNQINLAFESLEKVLLSKGFSLSDVIRQWTYIEDVLRFEIFGTGLKQFYQIFNDVRSSYFEKYDFKNGYMAATGIGTFAGVITTEVLAYRKNSAFGFNVKAVTNPKQINAYNYSDSKLLGTPFENFKKKATPKFERGKVLYTDTEKLVFISGTSSVVGEDTVNYDDTFKQTLTTIENIDEVLKSESLLTPKLDPLSLSDIKFLRIYLRNKIDFALVKSYCTNVFPNANCLCVLANICRHDLNIEIEAVAMKSHCQASISST
jgi:enamine deaminase RidA (YjgF/YER057c/UK114 family)